MHRLIMTSTVYRQSSRRDPAKDAVDSDNALLRPLPGAPARSRGAARPHARGQRPARPHAVRPAGAGGRGRGRPGDRARDDRPRRSVYLQVAAAEAAGVPGHLRRPGDEPSTATAARSSTTAPQSLMLMNSDFILQQAGALRPAAARRDAAGDGPARPPQRQVALCLAARVPAAGHAPTKLDLACAFARPAGRALRGGRAAGRRTGRPDEPVSATPRLQRVPLCGLTIATRTRRAFLARIGLRHRRASPWRTCCSDDGLLAETPAQAGREPAAEPAGRGRRTSRPKATAMISLFMHGGPSHVDLLDPKPELTRHARHRTTPATSSTASSTAPARSCSAARGSSPSTASAAPRCPSCCRTRRGSSTTSASSARCTPGTTATRCRSATSTAASPASPAGRRWGAGSSTAWAARSQNLPAYMVLSDPGGHPVDGTHNWSSGFLPPLYQGTVLRPQEPRILNLDPPPHLQRRRRSSRTSTSSTELNRQHLAAAPRRGRPGGAHRQLRAGRRDADGRQGGARRLAASRSTSSSCTASTRTRRASTARAA